jgi:hypothetical protein
LDMEDDRVTFAINTVGKGDMKKMRLPFWKIQRFYL